jgi:hypothetical protein
MTFIKSNSVYDIICYDVIIMSFAANESVKRLTELISYAPHTSFYVNKFFLSLICVVVARYA